MMEAHTLQKMEIVVYSCIGEELFEFEEFIGIQFPTFRTIRSMKEKSISHFDNLELIPGIYIVECRNAGQRWVTKVVAK